MWEGCGSEGDPGDKLTDRRQESLGTGEFLRMSPARCWVLEPQGAVARKPHVGILGLRATDYYNQWSH